MYKKIESNDDIIEEKNQIMISKKTQRKSKIPNSDSKTKVKRNMGKKKIKEIKGKKEKRKMFNVQQKTCYQIFKGLIAIADAPNEKKRKKEEDCLLPLLENNIPKNIKPYWDHNNQIIIHQFGTQINRKKFVLYLSLIIKYKFICNPDKTIYQKLQPLLLWFRNMLEEEYFFVDYNNNLTVMQKDVILSHLLYFVNNDYLPLLHSSLPDQPDCPLIIKERNRNVKYNILVDFKFILNIALSPLCLNTYSTVLKEQGIKTTVQKIKNEITKVLTQSNRNFLFEYPLPYGNYGVTLYNGNIIITCKMVTDLAYKVQACAVLLTTILHELCHYLKRALNNNDENYFNNTIETSFGHDDLVNYFDFLRIEERRIFYEKTALFVLDVNNYSLSKEDFKDNLVRIESKLSEKEKNEQEYGEKEYQGIRKKCGFHWR